MKDTLTSTPAMLGLLQAYKRKGDLTVWPSLPQSPPWDVLLIVIRSSANHLEPCKAYFIPADERDVRDWEMELAQVEGYLFLIERQEATIRYEALTLPATALYIRLCDNIVSSTSSEDALERFRGHIYFQELLYELYRVRDQWKSNSRTAVAHTRAYMDDHYGEEISIESLASMAGISPAYYMEIFKKIVGRSPIDYLTSVRINAARRLLDNTGAPARQVAESVGYKDPFYFSRQFKRVTGVSPSRYAKRGSLRIASLHYPMTGQMLALQHIPYAAPLDREFCQFYKQKYELQIPVHLRDPAVDVNMAFNLEALQEAKPDVVIAGDWLSKADQTALNGIASTLYIPWWEKDWREHLLLVGRFLGESSQAEDWLSNYDNRAAKIRRRLQQRLGESSVMAIHVLQGQIYQFGRRNLGTVLYNDLQLRFAGQHRMDKVYEPITFEELLDCQPDKLLVAVADDSQSIELWTAILDKREWKELPAVRNNSVHRIQPDPWFDYSALGNERILKELDKLFS
ncbi:AraC family transcriptional regulator [Paenibacillus albus]|uniref:Helix-turn-helix domain-containing protein n=1 Tax=Paenibacillus albus TaxID=2495582 RepID=A0A3S9ABG5_9BACL|nr:AraC family transcriptional regulator [Paenibacillus albus]AZN43072.1 helix-turn-helix domain-containing protein [Paenibacillus albus]